MKNETRMVAAIQNGTVIDHIPSDRLFEIVRLLHIEDVKANTVFIGYNLDSKMMGHKSIIKVADRYFSDAELNQLSVVAPNVTLSIIKNYEVAEKRKVEIPKEVRGIIKCNNPKCISNNEPMSTIFSIDEQAHVAHCHYCDKEQQLHEVKLA